MHFTTKVKVTINMILNRVGLEVSTTRAATVEMSRLRALQVKGHWSAPRYDQGLVLEEAEYLRTMKALSEYDSDLRESVERATGQTESFHFSNFAFDAADAGVLYGLIRLERPAHIIECGSGYSTRLMGMAISDGGLSTQLTAVDPEPRVPIAASGAHHRQMPIENVPLAEIVDTLQDGDILSVDSSHTVASGGDVVYLCLEVLPRLRRGVFVHFHDIFLPLDYPEEWVVKEQWGFTEQYLVHAFLAYNSTFEVVWPARYMWEYHMAAVSRAFPVPHGALPPSSLWLRKVG